MVFRWNQLQRSQNFLLLLDAWKESQLWWWTSPNQWKKVGMIEVDLLSWTDLNLLLLNEYAHCFSLNRLSYVKRNIWLCAEGNLSTGRLVYLFCVVCQIFCSGLPNTYISSFFASLDWYETICSNLWWVEFDIVMLFYAVHPMFSLFIVFFPLLTAGLKLFAKHSSQFGICLMDHYTSIFDVMSKLCGHINGELKKRSYTALESFLKQVFSVYWLFNV